MARVLAAAESPFRLHIKQRPSRVWVGWFRRPGRRWRQVCTAGSERQCWKALADYRDTRSVESERCVTRAGETPPPVGSRDE